jgi:CRP-like cAMP-binding protein
MSATAPSVEELRAIDLFDGLDDAQLGVWAASAQSCSVEAGEVLVEQDAPSRGLWLLLEGEVESLVVADGRSERIGHQEAPTWMGAIAALTEAPVGVEIRAMTAGHVALIPPERFVELALATPSVHRKVMQRVGPVLSRLSAREQHRERLAALGTMAAGLAHELNNPAAAANRAASDLIDAIKAIAKALDAFVEAGVEREDAEQLLALQREPPPARRSTRSTPPTRRTRCATASRTSASPTPGDWRSRSRALAWTRRGCPRSPGWPARRPTRRCAGSPPR